MKRLYLIIALAVLLLTVYGYSHRQTLKPHQADATVTVATTPVLKKNVVINLDVIGQVQPYATVAITPQVSGQLIAVGFREGEIVKQGQRLFQIDPRPYEAALAQAQANLARDQAQLHNTQLLLQRYTPLAEKGFVAKQDYDQAKANAKSQAATVQADTAAVQNAKLQLAYCTITAPITGRAGDLLMNVGNVVTANSSTPLVTINQLQPIYVSFNVPEQHLPALRREWRQHPITVAISHLQQRVSGQLTFINNTVDNATGAIQLKAAFANQKHQLWPGQFVHVLLPLLHLDQALIVPATAIQQGQQGAYVYVAADDIVHYRPVVLGPTVTEGVVIEKGLATNEQVVTAGQLRLTDDAKVRVAS